MENVISSLVTLPSVIVCIIIVSTAQTCAGGEPVTCFNIVDVTGSLCQYLQVYCRGQ